MANKKRRALIVLSEFGFWGEELIGPLETFDQAGYDVDFATPKGKRPVALPPSMDPDYLDPPLGRSVTSKEVVEKVKAIGQYVGNFGKETSVIVDYPFVTGRSTPDSYLTGQKMVEALDNGLTRYGW